MLTFFFLCTTSAQLTFLLVPDRQTCQSLRSVLVSLSSYRISSSLVHPGSGYILCYMNSVLITVCLSVCLSVCQSPPLFAPQSLLLSPTLECSSIETGSSDTATSSNSSPFIVVKWFQPKYCYHPCSSPAKTWSECSVIGVTGEVEWLTTNLTSWYCFAHEMISSRTL